MMSVHKLTAGDGYSYLVNQVAAHDSTELGKASLEGYYAQRGEAPGRWLGAGLVAFEDITVGDVVSAEQMKALWGEGRHPDAEKIIDLLLAEGYSAQASMAATKLGQPFKIATESPEMVKAIAVAFSAYNLERGERSAAPIDAATRATIRTDVATQFFRDEFDRDPLDARELSGWMAQQSRTLTTAVAGYDLTFSPVKSVSTLWAVAPREISERIEQAHRRAVEKSLASLEEQIAYTRIGSNGAARVRAEGLIAAAFEHRDSRAGDPDLHTHVPISNKVRYTGADGLSRWGALDGTPLYRLAVAASEEYNTRLEAEIRAEFPGATFTERPSTGRSKRPVRELVGVEDALMGLWSSRARDIDARTAELAGVFLAEHGREPTTVEQIALRQQANLETRQAKHEPRSLAEQRTQWRREAVLELGSESTVAAMVEAAVGPAGGELAESAAPTAPDVSEESLRSHAEHIVDVVSTHRSTWSCRHLRAESLRLARTLALDSESIDAFADAITGRALTDFSVQLTVDMRDGDLNEPDALRDRDGRSIFVDTGRDTYSSEAVLAAERRIVDASTDTTGCVVDQIHVDLALLEQEANGFGYNQGQAALLSDFAVSGRRFQLALAPAGTGKTSAMRGFASAWTSAGGTVIGLAPTAAAAQVLSADIGHGVRAETCDVFALLASELDTAPPDDREDLMHTMPDWFHQIGPGTVILIDEVGMTSTRMLDTIVSHAMAVGADIRAVGDDQQLASVAAGGVLRDVVAAAGAATLSEVVRFSDPEEGHASLALREGREEAIGYYIDQQRIHVSAESAAAEAAFEGWAADSGAGAESVMLAPDAQTVATLNERARDFHRSHAHPLRRLTSSGKETPLGDGLTARAGDIIRTRRNNRSLRLSDTDYVRNGYRWTVMKVHSDGSIKARHLGSGATVHLPAAYLSEHAEMGYAGTIHSAQGSTVGSRGKNIRGTCHVVGSDRLDRQLLYVALTRGVDANHLYLGTSESDPHNILFDKATSPRTAVDIVRSILARDGRDMSATTAAAQDEQACGRIARAGDIFATSLGVISEHQLGPEGLERIDDGAETIYPGLTDDQAWPILRRHLAVLALDPPEGRDAVDYVLAELEQVRDPRELDSARNVAAVLDWRLDQADLAASHGRAPLPWLPAIPDVLDRNPTYGPYLDDRKNLVTGLADEIRSTVDLTDPPAWLTATGITDHTIDPDLPGEIAVYRAAHRIPDTDIRPLGPEASGAASRRAQEALTARIEDASRLHAGDWDDLAQSIDPHLTADPWWPELSRRLTLAATRGVDVDAIIANATVFDPLPTESPAGALWWRIRDTLDSHNTPPAPEQSEQIDTPSSVDTYLAHRKRTRESDRQTSREPSPTPAPSTDTSPDIGPS